MCCKNEKMTENIILARSFAEKFHAGKKYGEHDYIVHLDDVYFITIEFGLDEDIQVAAYLHDILEDTNCTFEELWKQFGWTVAILVFMVTDEDGINRKERKSKTYAKTASSAKAILLKLSDRIANVRNALKTRNTGLIRMYKNEHAIFLDGLMISGTRYGVLGNMISELNSLFENG